MNAKQEKTLTAIKNHYKYMGYENGSFEIEEVDNSKIFIVTAIYNNPIERCFIWKIGKNGGLKERNVY